MQALSLAVHIPLVCFGIAFPALVLFVEWLGICAPAIPLYRTLARRWSKRDDRAVRRRRRHRDDPQLRVRPALAGCAWRRSATCSASPSRSRASRSSSRRSSSRIYVYGWNRLSPRVHLLTGIPIAITGLHRLADGDRGQRLDEPSDGLHACRTAASSNVHPFDALFANSYFWHELVHMYLAGYMVVGFVVAGVYAWGWLRGRWGRYERIALAIPLTVAALAAPAQIVVGDWSGRGRSPRDQPIKLAAFEGLRQTTAGAPDAPRWAGTTGRRVRVRHRDPRAALAARRPRPDTRPCRASTRSRRTTGRR